MGAISSFLVRLFKGQPFESQELDRLAEAMKVSPILKKKRLQRYFMSQALPLPVISRPDAIIFSARFCSMLLPEEVLAVAAHEFNHIVKRHIEKRYLRTVLPALIAAFVVGGFFAFSSFAFWAPAIVTGLSSFILVLFVSMHLNAWWLRQQETDCDLSALDFGYGEAMKSALAKTNANYTQTKWQMQLSKIIPQTHPTIERRIIDIQAALDKKKPVEKPISYIV